MDSGPGRRRCASIPRCARLSRVGGCEKFIQCVDGRISELLYANATARARGGSISPRSRCRRRRQARDREKVPEAIDVDSFACWRLFRRGGSRAGFGTSSNLRDAVRAVVTAGYFVPATSCSIFSSSFRASDISRTMDCGSSARAPSPGSSSKCWLSLKLPSFDAGSRSTACAAEPPPART